MKTFIALLRGINVGGRCKIIMSELISAFIEIGCSEVQTYIQSGNVVFKNGKIEHTNAFAKAIQEQIKTQWGYDIPVLVIVAQDLQMILENCPFPDEIMQQSYFTLLHKEPKQDLIAQLARIELANEQIAIASNCAYVFAPQGYGRAKLNNNFIERKLQVVATTRNYKTMHRLIRISKIKN